MAKCMQLTISQILESTDVVMAHPLLNSSADTEVDVGHTGDKE